MPSTAICIMPGRYIREGILDSERVNKLAASSKPSAELFYFKLLLVVDDHGRAEARPHLLKSKCFPVRENVDQKDILNFLKACKDADLLFLYKVNDKRYLQIKDFRQRTRGSSKFPEPPKKDVN